MICKEVTKEDALEGAPGAKVSITTAGRLLNKLGYHFGPLRRKYEMTGTKIQRIESFLKVFHKAFMEEREDESIIVYMDETYCHKTQQRQHGWRGKPSSVVGGSWNVAKKGVRKEKDIQSKKEGKGNRLGPMGGARMIIVHAMSREGLVCLQDHEGKYVEHQPNLVPERELTKHSHSAGMV
ncbi:hypothetical protein TrRE_jg8356, partial [Triparma retinervis]